MEGGDPPIHGEHSVQPERVEVDVEIEGTAETLNDHHGAASPVVDAIAAGAMPQEPEDRPHGDAGHGPTQRVIPGQQVPQPMWQAQHPLSHRYVRKYVIEEMGGPFSHSASTAPGAEAATLAGKGDEAIQAAGATSESGEAASQTAALQKVAKLLLHEARQPLAVPDGRRVRTKRLEMLPNELVQKRGRRIARFVNT